MIKLNRTAKRIALFLSIMLLLAGLAQAGLFDFRGKVIPNVWRTSPRVVDLMLTLDHSTDHTCYNYGDPVKFTLTNNGRSDIQLQPNWWIMNADTREIVYPGNLSEVWFPTPPTILASSTSIDWTWDQKRSNGDLVPNGRYIGFQVQFSNSFIITKTCGLLPPNPTDH